MDLLEWVSSNSFYNKTPIQLELINIGNSESYTKKETEKAYAQQSLKNCPTGIIDTLNKMVNDPLVMGTLCHIYHFNITSVDMWDGVEPLDWHFDGATCAEIVGLMYFNDLGSVPDNYGGQLVTGIRKIEPKTDIMRDLSGVKQIEVINPSDRTLVFVNNAAPIFVHKVTPLQDPLSQRLTLTFGCSCTIK
jgi:hypothetical protein